MNRILRPARYNNDNDDRTSQKMRDRSTRTEATTSSDDATDTSSSSLSHEPNSHPEYFWNESDSCCGVDSVVSHVHSVPNDGHTLNDDDDDDDDDLSFAPLDDDDDDDDNDGKSSFPQYDDDENDDNNFIETNVPNKYSQDCPFDEQQDRNEYHVVSQSPHITKPYEANSSMEHSPLNNSPSNDQFILQQKTLPGFDNSYKVVCVSFLEHNISTSVACRVLDESWRMLRPGGFIYIIDKGGCTVHKHPTMRQWLTRVRDPTVQHLIYEIETRAILSANGFVHAKLNDNNVATTTTTTTSTTDAGDWEDEEIVRWIGIKQ